MSKNQLTFSSLGVVFALYLFYGWVVVPFAVPQRIFSETRSGALIAAQGESVARDEYAGLFAEGAWERTSPKRMQFGNTVVLFQQRDDSVKGVIKISPCTIIQFAAEETPSSPDDNATAAEERRQQRLREAIVMQTREYALLEFSGAIDISQPTAIQLKQGQLFGDITVRSDGASPASDDDLRITCRDITLTESPLVTSITTLTNVDFQFGKNRGRGNMLTIEFARPSNDSAIPKTLSKIEFEKLDFLNLVLAGLPIGVTAGPPDAAKDSSLAIRCSGMFRFIPDVLNAGNWIAEFNDSVRVQRTNANGPPDTLEGQSLWVYFTPAARDDAKKTNTAPHSDIAGGFQSLTLAKLLAFGQPATLHIASYDDLVVQGERLCYSLDDNKIAVEKRDENSQAVASIDIRRGTHRIEGGRIHAAADQRGEFSSLSIVGAGRLRSTLLRDGKPSPINLSWNTKLTGATDSNDPTRLVFNVDDNVELSLDMLGKLRADGLQLICRRNVGKPAPRVENATSTLGGIEAIQPESAQAWGKIFLSSPFGTCLVKRLEVYFKDSNEPLRATNSRAIPNELLRSRPTNPFQFSVVTTAAEVSRAASPIQQVQYTTASSTTSSTAANSGMLTPISQLTGGANTPFDVSGELMKILVLAVANNRSEISQVWISGNVHVVQRMVAAAGAPASPPLEIRGREVHIWNPETVATEIRISGDAEQMATFQGRGISLTTTNLVVSRQQNTLWSEGIGRLTAHGAAMPLDSMTKPAPLLGAPVSKNSGEVPLVIDWNRGMSFNGRELLFEGVSDSTAETGVRILYEHRQIQARRVVVRLASLFSFFERATEAVNVQMLEAHGNVFIQNTQYVGDKMTSRDRAQLGRDVTLTFDLPSGALKANGYGRFQSTFLGQQISIPSLRDSSAPSEPDTGLGYIDVTFHDGLDGNVYNRSVTLAGQVDCKYSPVSRWDELLGTSDPAAFVKRGLLLTCGRLVIAATPNGAPNSPAGTASNEIEFRAEDKATIEGRSGQYTGTAESIQYSQTKDLLVMAGNGMANAILWQRDRAGDMPQKIELKRIEYQPRANILRASGLQQGIITTGGM